jgi:transposase
MSVMCILDKNGKHVKTMTIRGNWSKVVEALEAFPRPVAICYEASCGYGHLHDRLGRLSTRVEVAHPGQLRLIFRSKRKNDRVDAKKLATLLFLGQVPQVHVPSMDVRSWRSMIEFRHRLVAKQTRVKNGLRSLLRGHGIEQPVGRRMWSTRGVSWLAGVELPTVIDTLQRDMKLDELGLLQRQIKFVERELNTIAEAHPGVHVLQTIPGVGPRTAEAMVAYIDDPSRFSNNKKIGCYFGLVPREDSSVHTRLGHITQEGPSTVRRLLVEAAWQGCRRSPYIKAYFERIARGDRERRKIALVATAHYLARVMLAMLRTGECWRFDLEKREAA